MAEPCGHVTPQLFCAGFSRFLLAHSELQPASRDNVRVALRLARGASRRAGARGAEPRE